jgi:maltodextrin utilization protein YvdJ
MIFAVSNSFGIDYIVLKDGMGTKTKILDTNGCLIKIERNGYLVTLNKNLVKYVLMGNDTISYSNFECMQLRKTDQSTEQSEIIMPKAVTVKNDENNYVNQDEVNKDLEYHDQFKKKEISGVVMTTIGVISLVSGLIVISNNPIQTKQSTGSSVHFETSGEGGLGILLCINSGPSLLFGLVKWIKGGIYSRRIEKRLNENAIKEKS